MGSIVGLMLFVIALITIAAIMAVSAKKLAWQSAALAWFFWLCAGLLMQPWTFFTNQTTVIPVDSYWAPCWKIAAIVWAVSLLLCFVLLIAIYQGKKSRRRRRRRSSRSSEGGSRRSESRGSSRESSDSQRREKDAHSKKDDDEYEDYDDDSYEV